MTSIWDERARAIAARFRLSATGPDDPDVRRCMQQYLAAWGFPLDAHSTAERWTRVIDGADVVAVFGWRLRPGTRDLEITDLYPGSGRKGILGVYAIVELLKRVVDDGFVNSVSWVSEAANVRHNQALKRISGVEPVAYFWRYGRAPEDALQTDAQVVPDTDRRESAQEEEIFAPIIGAFDRAFQEVFARR